MRGAATSQLMPHVLHAQASSKPPLVFIHGSYHAAWCWKVRASERSISTSNRPATARCNAGRPLSRPTLPAPAAHRGHAPTQAAPPQNCCPPPPSQEHFLPYFASRGYSSYALSLRGQGGSDPLTTAVAGTLGSHAGGA
jgi:hypothetical protein